MFYTNFKYISTFLLIIAILLFNNSTIAQEYINDQLIVKYHPHTLTIQKSALKKQFSKLTTRRLGKSHIEVWEFDSTTQRLDDMLALLSKDPRIALVEPNYIYTFAATPNDPHLETQWNINNTGENGGVASADIKALAAWDIIDSAPSIRIGVIDSGVDWNHPDLVHNIWQNMGEDIDGDGQVLEWDGTRWIFDPDDENGIDDDNNGYTDDFIGWDFFSNDNDPSDIIGHGTHVAGIIGARGNNGIGITGVTQRVQLAALKAGGSNQFISSSSSLEALMYANMMDFHMTNNSYGGGSYAPLFYEEIENANDNGRLFITSAGNDGKDNDSTPFYPANYDLPNVISVAGTNRYDGLYNTGQNSTHLGATTVDLAAPAQRILSCYPDNRYEELSGTSMAAPHVAGAAALIWEQCNNLSHLEVKAAILNGVDPLPSLLGKTVSGGRLNIFQSLQTNEGSADFTFMVEDVEVDFIAIYQAGNTYVWDFGDGNMATGLQSNHTYQSSGTFLVQLTVNNDCATYTSEQIVAVGTPCEAAFTYVANSGANDNAVCQGNTVDFTNDTPAALSSEWKIDNVVVANSAQFSYPFSQVGEFTVSLKTATNGGECTYSEVIKVNSNARNLDLGRDIYTCNASATLRTDLPGQAAYLWDLNGNPYAAGMAEINVTQSGLYRVTIFDYCDGFAEDEIYVSLNNCNNVYPGDTNNDGYVNRTDALTLISKRGKTGPLRQNATTDFIPQVATDWNDTTPDNIDAKYADVDGDGVIDLSEDIRGMCENYGKQIDFASVVATPDPTNDYTLVPRKVGTIATAEHPAGVVFELILNNNTDAPLSIRGSAFQIAYANGINLALDTMVTDLGDLETNVYLFSKAVANGAIDVAIGRTDGGSVIIAPNAEFHLVTFVIDDNVVIDDESLRLSLDGIVLQNQTGDLIPIVGSSATASADAQNRLAGENAPLSVSMNSINALDCQQGATVTAFPAGGVLPYTYDWNTGQNTATINNTLPGTYTVTITDAQQAQVVENIFAVGNVNCNSSLAVESIDLTVQQIGEKVTLRWETNLTEWAHSFRIERAIGDGQFTLLTTMNGKVNQTNYQYYDSKVRIGQTYLYRVVAINSHHQLSSSVQSVTLTQLAQRITIAPNPVRSGSITLSQLPTSTQQIIVRKATGEVVQRLAGNATTEQRLDFGSYGVGIYFIEVWSAEGREVVKVVHH